MITLTNNSARRITLAARKKNGDVVRVPLNPGKGNSADIDDADADAISATAFFRALLDEGDISMKTVKKPTPGKAGS